MQCRSDEKVIRCNIGNLGDSVRQWAKLDQMPINENNKNLVDALPEA
jgi:hypothetical protein